ncbi:hypothetical protein ACIQD5_27925 [Streptomyces microflavus]|uniref:hypothetical protein n=1 Tax=Streptomyces microflavus TaxID=1919 RepID=UPI003825AAB3
MCQISVRETAWPGQTMANGSIYFRWRWEGEGEPTVAFRQSEGFPSNMSLREEGDNSFTFSLDKRGF